MPKICHVLSSFLCKCAHGSNKGGWVPIYKWSTGADLGFIKGGGGLTQGTNLLDRGVQSTLPSMQSMLELGGSGGMPPRKILKNRC